MKRILIVLLIILLAFILYWCTRKEKEQIATVVFSGFVLDYENGEIEGATILINGIDAMSNSEGKFSLTVDSVENYIFSIDAEGFGPINKLYNSSKSSTWRLGKATTGTFDASTDITLTDTTEDCFGSHSENAIQTLNNISDTPLVYDSEGRLIGFEYPQVLKEAYDAHVNRNLCNNGVSVLIPAGGLWRRGQPVTGNVKLSVSTIDLFAPDAMPGDYSVSSAEQPTYMVSVGAGTINATQEGEKLQLGPKVTATVTIPIDLAVVSNVDSLPDRIPFLVYVDSLGEWQQKGFGSINEARTAYIAQTDHLSTFNMDHTKTDPSCLGFCFDSGLASTNCYPVEITIPDVAGGSSIPKTLYFEIQSDGGITCPTAGNFAGCFGAHFVKNLPNNTPIGIRVFNPVAGCGSTSPTSPPTLNTLLSSYVIYTGAAYSGTPGGPGCATGDYESCAGNGNLILSETMGPKIQLITAPPPTGAPTGPFPEQYSQNDGSIELSWIYRTDFPNTFPTDEISEFRILYRSGLASYCDVAIGSYTEHTTVVTATADPTYAISSLSIPGFGTPDLYEFKIVAYDGPAPGGILVNESSCVLIEVN